MISGTVIDRHAIVSLTFLLVNGKTFPIEFVVDTGFTDHLCLPPEAVNLLRLPFLYSMPVNLADNSTVSMSNCILEVPMYYSAILGVRQESNFWGWHRDGAGDCPIC